MRLSEIKMSPGRLALGASDIPALVGIEYELNYPMGNDDDNNEPDMSEDVRTKSIDQIYEFFNENEINSGRTLRELKNELMSEYDDWRTRSMDTLWKSSEYDQLYAYYEANGGYETEEEIKRAVAYAKKYKFQAPEYYEVHDAFIEDLEDFDDYSEKTWLETEYPMMSDILSSFNLNWPYFISSTQTSIEEVAHDFGKMIGMKVNWSKNYHGAKRSDDAYALEPDSSINSDDVRMFGLEFISPPLPVDVAIIHLQKVRSWANDVGCETNESTGLHINVSLKNRTGEDLDYVKMALFLGDHYVLSEFGREGNNYAESAFDNIKDNVKDYPSQVSNAFLHMKDGLNLLASKIIHDKITDKYTSINVKNFGMYLEIRSPGGDWLNEDLDKLISTIHRIAVAADVAYDSTKYKKEYTIKLYKMLASSQNDHLSELFARFANGELTADQLKLGWANAKIEKSPKIPQLATKILDRTRKWQVVYTLTRSTVIVTAGSKEEALEKGRAKIAARGNTSVVTATIADFEVKGLDLSLRNERWGRWIVTLSDNHVVPVAARNYQEATTTVQSRFPDVAVISAVFDQ